MGAHHRSDSRAVHKGYADEVDENLLLPRFHQILELIAKSADRNPEDEISLKIQDGDVALRSNFDVHIHLA